eukprot:5226409-Pleurochrysis_carterae.AAC.1
MDVWWASGSVHAFVGEKLGELAGKKFTCVVAVKGTNHSRRGLASFVEEGREPCEEESDVLGSFMFVLQHVDRFKPGMVVYDDERIAASSIDGGQEGSGDVYVDESAWV